MYFVYPKKASHRETGKVMEWVIQKKGTPNVLLRSLYMGVKRRVIVDYELSEKCEVKVRVHQGSVLSPLLLAAMVDATS